MMYEIGSTAPVCPLCNKRISEWVIAGGKTVVIADRLCHRGCVSTVHSAQVTIREADEKKWCPATRRFHSVWSVVGHPRKHTRCSLNIYHALKLTCPECNVKCETTEVSFAVTGMILVEADCPDCGRGLYLEVSVAETLAGCCRDQETYDLMKMQVQGRPSWMWMNRCIFCKGIWCNAASCRSPTCRRDCSPSLVPHNTDFLAVCYSCDKRMMEEFERQFYRRRLRIEESDGAWYTEGTFGEQRVPLSGEYNAKSRTHGVRLFFTCASMNQWQIRQKKLTCSHRPWMTWTA